MDLIGIVILGLFLVVIITLAQVRIFSIDKTLKEIRDELKARKSTTNGR